VHRQDFSYHLPEELIAQSPLAERSASRLLVLDGATGDVADRLMGDLPGYLRAGDLLVFNDTRVVAARIVGSKPSGGRVELFLERAGVHAADESDAEGRERSTDQSGIASDAAGGEGKSLGARASGLAGTRLIGSREALVQLRASKPIREGLEVATAGGVVRVLGREDELWRVRTPEDALEFFEKWGEVPLPPYIHRRADSSDRERYQSIFAREKGAVAAPTASLHFDAPLIEKLDAKGVGRAFVTLHVGAGTFQPLRTDDLDAHKMHAERVSVSRATWNAIRRTRAAGGRVVAVGTTVVRALEAAALEAAGLEAAGLEAVGLEAVGLEMAAETVPSSGATTGREMAESGESATNKVAGAGTSGEFARMPKSQTVASSGATTDRVPESEVRGGLREDARTAQGWTQNAWSGETRLFIRPGFKFQIVDAMVTNFHLPESTLLMLVSAFAGRENVLAAYAHAVRERYRFFSYGDAMFVMPAKPTTRLTATRPDGAATP